MIFALTLLCASIPGGWQQVGYDTEYVRKVIPYINKNFRLILPEYKNQNSLCVFQSAEVQVVNGYNIHLTHKLGKDIVEFTLHVSITNEISLTDFKHTPDTNNLGMVGAWEIQKPDYEPEEVYRFIKYYIMIKGVNTMPEKTLFVRTKVVQGLHIHIVYNDNLGKTHSIVMERDLSDNINVISNDSF